MHLNYFAGMTKCSHEFVIKEEIKFVNISKVREQAPLFSSNFAHGQRCTRKKKVDIQKLYEISIPMHPRSMNRNSLIVDKEERSHGVR